MTLRIYTDIEQLHRRAAEQSQRFRYVQARPRVEDPRRALAHQVESDIAGRLRAQGYHVARTAPNARFDLLVNGLRVEVKAATWSPDRGRYAANLRGNQADVLVFGCQNSALHYFVIPFDRVRGQHFLQVSSHDPERYAGRWRAYLEAWYVLDELIARGVNHWQTTLWEGLEQ